MMPHPRLEVEDLRVIVRALPADTIAHLVPVGDPFCGVCLALDNVPGPQAATLCEWHDAGVATAVRTMDWLRDAHGVIVRDGDALHRLLNELAGPLSHARCELLYAIAREETAA